MSTIDFNFLRECIKVLKVARPVNFSMLLYMRDWPDEDNNWCGTPACVLGHWATWKAGHGARRESISALIDTARIGGPRSDTAPDLLWIEDDSVYGLTREHRRELFGCEGCGNAKTPGAAIRYLERFILQHGGSLEDPKPLLVVQAPNWDEIAQLPAADEVRHEHV